MSRNESSKDVDFLVEDLWLEYKVEFLFVSWNLSHIRCSGALPPPYKSTKLQLQIVHVVKAGKNTRTFFTTLTLFTGFSRQFLLTCLQLAGFKLPNKETGSLFDYMVCMHAQWH